MIKEILLALFLILSFVGLHETAHGEIYRAYGCTDITYEFHWYYAQTLAKCNNENSTLANSINEVVGYGISPFLIAIIMIMIIDKRDDR